jgi:hypothetical protein
VEGQDVVFQCRVAGIPLPTITWRKLDKSKYIYFLTSGGITIIEHMTKSRVIIMPLMAGERKCWGKGSLFYLSPI